MKRIIASVLAVAVLAGAGAASAQDWRGRDDGSARIERMHEHAGYRAYHRHERIRAERRHLRRELRRMRHHHHHHHYHRGY